MAVGVVATYNNSYHSPGFDIVVSGISGYDTLTIMRIDLTGECPDTPVRGADSVAIAGSGFAVTDFEAPIGKNIVYRAIATAQVATDNFNRTTASGWGVASFGEAWTIQSGAASSYSTNGSVASITMGTRPAAYQTVLASDFKDVDVLVKVTLPTTVTGGPVTAGVMARFQDIFNFYYAAISFSPGNSATLEVYRVAGGTTSFIASTGVSSFNATAGSSWFLRFQMAGDRFAARAWSVNDNEAFVTTLSGTVPTQVAGKVGIQTQIMATNTNTIPYVLVLDDFKITALGADHTLTSTGSSSSTGIQDGFSRSATNGWGTPDVGSPWAVRSGPIGDFAAVNGVGRMSMTVRSVSGSLGTDYVMGVPLNHTDIDQKVKVRTQVAASGDVYRLCLVARETDRDNWWEFEMNCAPNGEVRVRMGRESNGVGWYTHADNGILIPGLTHTAGAWYWVRFQCVGTQLRGKVWADGSSEPDWQLSITTAVNPTGNYVGLKSYSQAFSTNPTPEIVEFDDYSLTILNNNTMIPYVDPGTAWLKSVGQPVLSRRVNLSDWSESTNPARVLGEYEVLGRRNKVVLTDVPGGREGTIVLATYKMGPYWESDCDLRSLVSLLELGGTLLLQTTGIDNTGEGDLYFQLTGGVKRSRIGVVGGDFAHLFEFNFIEVDRPASIEEALSLRSWQSVVDQNPTWQAVATNHSTWLDVLQRDL